MGTREAARPVRSEGPGLRGSDRGPPPRGQSPGEVTQRRVGRRRADARHRALPYGMRGAAAPCAGPSEN